MGKLEQASGLWPDSRCLGPSCGTIFDTGGNLTWLVTGLAEFDFDCERGDQFRALLLSRQWRGEIHGNLRVNLAKDRKATQGSVGRRDELQVSVNLDIQQVFQPKKKTYELRQDMGTREVFHDIQGDW